MRLCFFIFGIGLSNSFKAKFCDRKSLKWCLLILLVRLMLYVLSKCQTSNLYLLAWDIRKFQINGQDSKDFASFILTLPTGNAV